MTTVRFSCRDVAREAFLEVAPYELRAATLNGAPIELAVHFDAQARRLRLAGMRERNELVVDAVMSYSHDGEGLHRYTDPADGRSYVYAMSFLNAAPRWYACFDQPDLKAPVELTVRCAPEWCVAGNGPATEVAPGYWQIAPTGPLATYFTTVVAGPYHQLRDEHDGIRLGLHVRQSLGEHLDRDATELFAHTKRSFDQLHQLFGYRYPWGEYHQAFVPEFNAGAMENPGCVTLRDEMIFRSKATDAELADRRIGMAHEMAHMWFGDLVTMRWWDDLWLNESFAEYLGHRVTGADTWAHFGSQRKSWGYAADRRPSTHPIAGNGAADATTALTEFDGISYAKGASVLRQLASYLGDEVFLGGLRHYIRDHANGNAQFADLLVAWTESGASDLDAWAPSWLTTTGMDELAVEGAELVRRAPDDASRPHAISVAVFDADGTERDRAALTVSAARTPIPVSRGDLVLPDVGDETWAKVRLEPKAWQTMPTTLAALPDARARVTIWNALRLAVEDAEVDPALALNIAVSGLPAEPEVATLAAVGKWVDRRLVGVYLGDAQRAEALPRTAAAMLAVCDRAEPGSGRQLAAFRLAVSATDQASQLRSWLAGADLPNGVELDPELRWSVLTRLAQLGELTEAEIGAEAEADRSSQGAVHAARCRAARPDPAAKAAAWQTMMSDSERPNYELYALAEGFWQPHQRDLTAGYVGRYFDEIPTTASLRSGWVVDRLALYAYPWVAADAATVDATARLLARPDLTAGIRRSVVDAGDDLRRAVAVRDRYGH